MRHLGRDRQCRESDVCVTILRNGFCLLRFPGNEIQAPTGNGWGFFGSWEPYRDSGLGTRDSGLGTRDSGLGTRDAHREQYPHMPRHQGVRGFYMSIGNASTYFYLSVSSKYVHIFTTPTMLSRAHMFGPRYAMMCGGAYRGPNICALESGDI
jgi:hypothetical protein